MPGQAIDPLGGEPLDPAVEGARAAEQERGDGDPGMAVVEQEEDVGAEADLGLGVFPISVEQGRPLLGAEGDASCHDGAGV